MKGLHVIIPSTLTEEEEELKKSLNHDPDAAAEELRKKVMCGSFTLQKKNEKSTFKRSRGSDTRTSLNSSQVGEDGEIFDDPSPWSPSPSNLADSDITRVRHNALCVRGIDLQSDMLRNAFTKYGKIMSINVDNNHRSAVVHFAKASDAEYAMRKMNGQMLNGITIRVTVDRSHESRPTRFIPPQPIQTEPASSSSK
ncbi:unnamed protein product [Caenorhabditis auriculariae]|uniref:Negative elongation factor E n=1 Tax=Caenorhabditis auriculariae TaxID=2777116 RepID=A0A8S1GZ70_9PELO|nr:unnamed protein product [Caenorhabditis auriculariae]